MESVRTLTKLVVTAVAAGTVALGATVATANLHEHGSASSHVTADGSTAQSSSIFQDL